MYSLEELFYSFIIAIVFIYIFKLQKELFSSYWAISDILSDIEQSPSLKDVIIRCITIFIFGIVLNFLVSPKIILLGITLGSFLIVWPVFLSDENIIEELREQKLVLRTLLALFVVISFVIARLSIIIFDLSSEVVNIYLQSLNYERFVSLIGDSLLWTIILLNIRKIIYLHL